MTTFISCFVEIYDTPFADRTNEWRINNFLKIARTGIQLCLYTCDITRPIMENVFENNKSENNWSNIKLMEIRGKKTFKEMFMYEESMKYSHCTPASIRGGKDTAEFMALMHNKIEFIKETIEQNPWNSTVFSWIDFNIGHVLNNEKKTMEIIRQLGQTQFVENFLCIPGCWHIDQEQRLHEYTLKFIHWRFCGGFLIGDKNTMLNFYEIYRKYYPLFLETYEKLLWEVNFWTWLEDVSDSGWKPTWYKADHNDSILEITADIFSKSCDQLTKNIQKNNKERTKYDYPEIDKYLPTSASYLYYMGQHILNTRFINYWLYPTGSYLFKEDDGIIRNKNIMSILDINLKPLSFQEMDSLDIRDPHNIVVTSSSSENPFSEGLEDMRLYEYNGKIRFIASTVNYGRNGRIEMINGDYNLATLKFCNCRVIGSPYDQHMEKNWIPMIRHIEERQEELFLYKWWPLEFGKINNENNRLEIIERIEHSTPYFEKVRGSSIFVPSTIDDNELIGVVHFSEEKWPRHYSHLLVTLDKNTFRPIRYTEPFHFNERSVEFCIGFTMIEDEYCFWISNFDREPEQIKMKYNSFVTWYNFVY